MALEKIVNLLRNAFANPVEDLADAIGEVVQFPPAVALMLAQGNDEVHGEVIHLPDEMLQTLGLKL